MAEKIFDAQSNYGWGLTLNMTGKAPAVSKRIFDTLADAQAFANDYNDSAIEGLLLSVVADGNNNGVYFVKSIKAAADADAAVLEKLSSANAAAGDLSGALAALDLADTAVDGEYVSKVSQEDGKISVSRAKFADAVVAKDAEGNNIKLSEKFEAIDTAIADAQAAAIASGTKFQLVEGESHLELANATSEAGSVTYTLNSKDVASAKELDDLEALVGNKTDKSGTDTVFGHIDAAKVAAANAQSAADIAGQAVAQEITDRQTAINTEIENRGKAIDALKAELTGTLEEADAKTLAALNDKIDVAITDAKSYSIKAVENASSLGTNVKEAYQLVDEDNTPVGDTIKIYKDSSLKEVKLNDQSLDFTYILADGSESTVGVDVSSFLAESEFKNGLEVNALDHTVSVKVDAASENFLSVSEAGIKVSGINDAIDNKIKDLDADITSAEGTKVRVQVVEADGKVTEVKVSESDIASAQALSDLSALVGTADDTKDKATAFGKAAEAKAAAEAASTAAGNSLADAKTYTNEELAKLAAEKTATSGNYISSIKQVNGLITEIGETALPTHTLATGSANGTVAFDGQDVSVKGLGSAAYTEASAYDAAGSADAAKNAVIGSDADASSANTVYGAKAYTDEALTWYEG